jgi:hypothetical protein
LGIRKNKQPPQIPAVLVVRRVLKISDMVRKIPTVRGNNRSVGIPSFLYDIVVIVSRGSDGFVKEWLCGHSIRIQEESIPTDFLFIHLKGYASHSASTADRCLAVYRHRNPFSQIPPDGAQFSPMRNWIKTIYLSQVRDSVETLLFR